MNKQENEDLEKNIKAVFEIALGHYEKLNSLLRSKYRKYNRTGLGLKHRLSPLHAAIARVQLRKFPQINASITENCESFRNEIRDLPKVGFDIPEIPVKLRAKIA